jgi:hypothetical protein
LSKARKYIGTGWILQSLGNDRHWPLDSPANAPTLMTMMTTAAPLPLHFDNAFIRELPADGESGPRPREVRAALYSEVAPTAVSQPRLIAYSREMAEVLGFSEDQVKSKQFADVFGGNALFEGMQPFASNYGGHQFGHWAGQLGDGRAITLGEVVAGDS